jgi:hypothetical protein
MMSISNQIKSNLNIIKIIKNYSKTRMWINCKYTKNFYLWLFLLNMESKITFSFYLNIKAEEI